MMVLMYGNETRRLLLERSNLRMAARLIEGLGCESKDMPLKSIISTWNPLISSSIYYQTAYSSD